MERSEWSICSVEPSSGQRKQKSRFLKILAEKEKEWRIAGKEPDLA